MGGFLPACIKYLEGVIPVIFLKEAKNALEVKPE